MVFLKENNLSNEDFCSSIYGKSILITGAGTIGAQLAMTVAELKPKALIIVDNCEFNLFLLKGKLIEKFPTLNFSLHLISVTDYIFLGSLIASYELDYVFHTASFKHVSLLQNQIKSAFLNNVIGAVNIINACRKAGVKKVIITSTDKAVYPSSIMGLSKRIAEIYSISCYKGANLAVINVRFGNVYGSSGSVKNIFENQINMGGPVTVTHPDVTRYFMSLNDSNYLLLSSLCEGKSGDLFLYDMGEPIKIKDLAKIMIKRKGLILNKDIKIVYTGLTEGEKLHEELFYPYERPVKTSYGKVLQISCDLIEGEFEEKIKSLDKNKALCMSDEELRNSLLSICKDVDNHYERLEKIKNVQKNSNS